jgi:hypothetical protein
MSEHFTQATGQESCDFPCRGKDTEWNFGEKEEE